MIQLVRRYAEFTGLKVSFEARPHSRGVPGLRSVLSFTGSFAVELDIQDSCSKRGVSFANARQDDVEG